MPRAKRQKLHGVSSRSPRSAFRSGDKSRKSPLEGWERPTTLEGFGYGFNADGQLRHLEKGTKYEFEVRKDDQEFNQAVYDCLGSTVTQEVYRLLETDGGLERVWVPRDSDASQPRTFVFLSEDALSNPEKLLLLIHGSGVVRAGQWSRSLIINDSLNTGTMLPYIKRAREEGYGVIVLNPNDNELTAPDGSVQVIPGLESPEAHTLYVWQEFVREAKARQVAIVAHSYGGVCTETLVHSLCNDGSCDDKERLKAIAFTDSVHGQIAKQGPAAAFMKERCVNWVCSDEPLDTPVAPYLGSRAVDDCLCVSAGTDSHIHSSASAFESVFRFLGSKIE